MTKSIIVVGGGLVGTSTAYHAAKAGLDVTLIEQKHVAHGASGRNPGFVWLHCRNPGWALDISLKGVELLRQLRQDLPVPFEFRQEGGLIYFTQESQRKVMEEFVELRSRHGLDMDLIDTHAVKEKVPALRDDVLGASFCANDAQIKTPTVVAALAAGAVAHGARIHERLPVTKLLRSGDAVVGVRTPDGDFYADVVVVATGAWTEHFMRDALGLEVRVGRERLQVMATEKLPRSVGPITYGPETAKVYTLFRDLPSWNEEAFTSDIERELGHTMLTLAAQRADGEILLGCPIDYPGHVDLRPTLDGLGAISKTIARDFPSLADAAIDRVWAGVLPFTSDMVPIVDFASPGLFLAAGHVFGNSSGPMTGKVVAQMLLGEETDVDMHETRWDRPLDPIVPGKTVVW
ncbi:NAD(P)/FAD-dependent oxidoreductase [Microbacterium sp.]|uniref:NAD(P)/FAD-dependent oxidoreductase n=1 Tax=Microbacterium sp. TaxID=51671 RepID=UPI002811A5E5|nr:FAD-binding oxidoreductase [Microbacterium sp.]